MLCSLTVSVFAACEETTEPSTGPSFSTTAGFDTKIAFIREIDDQGNRNWDIYAMNPDGSGVIRLTTDPGFDRFPRWSPDGTRIAFDARRGPGHLQVYTMNADGTGQINISNNSADESVPDWSPDGTRIAFHRSELGQNSDIYTMNVDGTGRLRLTDDPAWDAGARWSPDGSRILFVRAYGHCYIDGNDIFIMNTDGTEQTNLTAEWLCNGLPSWSPDGSKVAFASDLDGGLGLYTMNPDASGVSRIPATGATHPGWSPDGSQMVFERDGDIYVMKADGSEVVNITNTPGVNETHPHWGVGSLPVPPPPPPAMPPVADAGPDQTVLVGVPLAFQGSGSDPDGEITAWHWDFGDNSADAGQTVSHVFVLAGTYIVTLTVTDNDGLAASDDAHVTVQTPAEALEQALLFVEYLELRKGIEQALSATLRSALNTVDLDIPATLNQLDAYLHQVEAMRGEQLANAEADQLRALALLIIQSLEFSQSQ